MTEIERLVGGSTVGMNGEFYRAAGKPKYETIVTGGALIIYLSVYLYVINNGLNSFVWARMWLAIGALFLHVALLKYLFDINVYAIFVRILLITTCSIISVYSAKYIAYLIFNDVIGLLLMGGMVSVLFVVLIIFAVERNKTIVNVVGLIKKDNK